MDANWPPKNDDILRMFRQMVDQTGVEKHTSEEWQEAYEDFCRCMQSPSEPFVAMSSFEGLLRGKVAGEKPRVLDAVSNDALSSSGNVAPSTSSNVASSSSNVASSSSCNAVSSSSRKEAPSSSNVTFCSSPNEESSMTVVVNEDEEQFMDQYDVQNVVVENEEEQNEAESGDSSSSNNETSSETENVEENGNEMKNEGSGSEGSSSVGDDSSETDEFEENANEKKNESADSSSSDSEISSTVEESNEMNNKNEQSNWCINEESINQQQQQEKHYGGNGYDSNIPMSVPEKQQQVNTYHIPPKIQDYPQRPIKQPSPMDAASTSKRSRSPPTGQKPSEFESNSSKQGRPMRSSSDYECSTVNEYNCDNSDEEQSQDAGARAVGGCRAFSEIWLKKYNRNTSTKVSHDIGDTSEFFNNLPGAKRSSIQLRAALHSTLISNESEQNPNLNDSEHNLNSNDSEQNANSNDSEQNPNSNDSEHTPKKSKKSKHSRKKHKKHKSSKKHKD